MSLIHTLTLRVKIFALRLAHRPLISDNMLRTFEAAGQLVPAYRHHLAVRHTWTDLPCDDPTCTADHRMPPNGARVVVLQSSLRKSSSAWREPGSNTVHNVEAGTQGVAVDNVPEWHDVHVCLDDGRRIWVSPEFLTDASALPVWNEATS